MSELGKLRLESLHFTDEMIEDFNEMYGLQPNEFKVGIDLLEAEENASQ